MSKFFCLYVPFFSHRIRNAYVDPQRPKRPIKHISWSPHASNRLAAAYWFAEFDEQPPNANPYSYVWDIGTRALLMLFQVRPRLIGVPCGGTAPLAGTSSIRFPEFPFAWGPRRDARKFRVKWRLGNFWPDMVRIRKAPRHVQL